MASFKQCCFKYFWEGQTLAEHCVENEGQNTGAIERWMNRHRRLVGVALPAIFFYVLWVSVAVTYDLWHLFNEKYGMSITMVFGSMIAGMTSEGGGAVAYPVMTLAMKIKPAIARDFSMMIQSCGMTAASFSIWYMGVLIEKTALLWCSLGGVVGVCFGLSILEPSLTAAQQKITFVSVWFSFAFALFLLNWNLDRPTYRLLPVRRVWVYATLLTTGVIGGLFTSIAGSGLDITCFSVLTLMFRLSEKTATPTSVVLMAINTCVGFFWRQIIMQDVVIESWEYLAVCVPVVVIGAPLGALLGTHFHRLVQAAFIYILDTFALISALIIVQMTSSLWILCVLLLIFGFALFFTLTMIGKRLVSRLAYKQDLS